MSARNQLGRDRGNKGRPLGVLLICVALGLWVACGSVSNDTDATDNQPDSASSPADAPTSVIDSSPDPDAPITPTTPSTSYQSSGGGEASSANYQVQLRIAAPQPMGNSASSNFNVRLGPTGF